MRTDEIDAWGAGETDTPTTTDPPPVARLEPHGDGWRVIVDDWCVIAADLPLARAGAVARGFNGHEWPPVDPVAEQLVEQARRKLGLPPGS